MKKITLEMLKKFKEYLIEDEKSAVTIEKYLRDIKNFIKWSYGKELTKSLVLDYKAYLMQNFSPASVNSMISSLNTFFCYKKEYRFKVKLIKIQRKIFINKEKELTRSEYERLLCAANKKGNKRLYYLIQTICSTGIRVSELRFITVEAVCKGQAVINCKGKMRTVIIPGQLCKILSLYAKEQKIANGSIFITKNGKPLDRSNICHDMKKLCKMANVPKEKVFPHNLRHLFARTYYSIQKDIVRLADILGHSNINTTRIYTMETGDIHRAQLQKLGLLIC